MHSPIRPLGPTLSGRMPPLARTRSIQAVSCDRSQAASIALPPELEPLRTQAIQVLDMYISACDFYLDAIATGDLTKVDQANALIQEATNIIQGLLPSY